MTQQIPPVHEGNRGLDMMMLPEIARQELMTFYEFLVLKYQKKAEQEHSDKQRILSQIFQEANGILPAPYTFNREAIHER